jgi:hypothetical protein
LFHRAGAPDLQAQANVVHIPDLELQTVIRATLNKPAGDITVAEMESLTFLDASSATRGEERPAITSLEGLEAARNLRTLNFASGIWWMDSPDPTVLATTNLAVLSTLSNLENLDLSFYGRAQPARPTLPPVLSSLTNLQSLNLECAPLADSSFLTNLTRLHTVNLGETGLKQMPPLVGLTNLEVLWLNDNWGFNVSIPPGLSSLRELHLHQMVLGSLTLPHELPNLDTLSLWNNQLTNISFLAPLPNLRKLDLTANRLTQLSLPDTASRLEILSVESNPLTNITLPASINLSDLTLTGFAKDKIMIRGLWMRQPVVDNDGVIRIRITGAAGRTVYVQRSVNLLAWEPWRTATLIENGAEFRDDDARSQVGFFRVHYNPAN